MYILYNNDDNPVNEMDENFIEEESLFEVRKNGFIKNSTFNTDEEFNISDVNTGLIKISSKLNSESSIYSKDENRYNDLFFWDNKNIILKNIEFLNDL